MRVLRPRLVGNSATPLERARPDAYHCLVD